MCWFSRFSWFIARQPAPALVFTEPTLAILCWFSGDFCWFTACQSECPYQNMLVQNGHLLVQRWFKMKIKGLIKQKYFHIEPTELTEPIPFLRM
jgi:hypothetical protein